MKKLNIIICIIATIATIATIIPFISINARHSSPSRYNAYVYVKNNTNYDLCLVQQGQKGFPGFGDNKMIATCSGDKYNFYKLLNKNSLNNIKKLNIPYDNNFGLIVVGFKKTDENNYTPHGFTDPPPSDPSAHNPGHTILEISNNKLAPNNPKTLTIDLSFVQGYDIDISAYPYNPKMKKQITTQCQTFAIKEQPDSIDDVQYCTYSDSEQEPKQCSSTNAYKIEKSTGKQGPSVTIHKIESSNPKGVKCPHPLSNTHVCASPNAKYPQSTNLKLQKQALCKITQSQCCYDYFCPKSGNQGQFRYWTDFVRKIAPYAYAFSTDDHHATFTCKQTAWLAEINGLYGVQPDSVKIPL